MKLAIAASTILIGAVIPAKADWIREATSEHCSEESRDRIAASTRNQIESSVRRAEAAIEPPASVSDLSCLDGLMDLQLDWFAPAGGLESIFAGTLDGSIGSGDHHRRICRSAERRWGQLTKPLNNPLALLKRGLPPDFGDSFDLTRSRGPNTGESSVIQDQSAAQRTTSSAVSDSAQASGPRPNTGILPTQTQEIKNNPVDEIWRTLYGRGSQ